VSLQTDIMKTRFAPISISVLAGLGLLTASAMNLAAQISVAPNVSSTAPAVPAAPVRLSYGVADVLKLAKAHVSEDTIIAYVANSGTAYNLTVNEIVYLKEQGVSDHVLTAMLDQHNKLAVAAAQNVQAAPGPPQANYSEAGPPQYAPAVAQPPAMDMQTAPAAASDSSVYVIPSSSQTYVYSGYYPSYAYGYPYYGGYYGYGYPGLAVGIGFGGVWCGSGWCGGYHGGYHGGGGGGHHH